MDTLYVKDGHTARVSQKYVYHTSVHRLYKWGGSFLGDKYYASSKPLNLKKVPIKVKKKDYTIQRFVELESAPEHYLIKIGYKKLIEN